MDISILPWLINHISTSFDLVSNFGLVPGHGGDQPPSGKVVYNGQSLGNLNGKGLVHLRREQIGFVFQWFALLSAFSNAENVEFMFPLAGRLLDFCHKRASECLNFVGLENRKNCRPGEFLGGHQQRVAIARAIANQPALILADDLTGELDTSACHQIVSLFQCMFEQRENTIQVASHGPLVDEVADKKIEIISLVEQSSLSIKKTLKELDVPRSSFFCWYLKYQNDGLDDLFGKALNDKQIWNMIPDQVRTEVVEIALEKPALSCWLLAWEFVDEKHYYLSESSINRILKGYDLIQSPVFRMHSAKQKYEKPTRNPTTIKEIKIICNGM